MEKPTGMTLAQRITGVLLNPTTVFEDIAERPSWLPALILISIINLIATLINLPKLKEFIIITLQQQAHSNPALSSPATQDMAVNAGVISAVVGGALGPIIMCLIFAGLLKLCNIFAGETTPYKRFFAITVYAYMPLIIATIIGTVMIALSPASNLMEISTGLYLLFPPGTKGFLANLARQIDPFYIWSVFLIALGGATMAKSKIKPFAIFMFTIWAVYVAGSALLSKGF
jgi:hypothetical protein